MSLIFCSPHGESRQPFLLQFAAGPVLASCLWRKRCLSCHHVPPHLFHAVPFSRELSCISHHSLSAVAFPAISTSHSNPKTKQNETRLSLLLTASSSYLSTSFFPFHAKFLKEEPYLAFTAILKQLQYDLSY